MRSGDFARAWRIGDCYIDALPRSVSPHSESAPLWRGQPLDGKRVLVRCRHGLGDTIQFIRFTAGLRLIARQVTVSVQPQLVALISAVRGVDRAVADYAQPTANPYDVEIDVMELAHALRSSADLVCCEPYLCHPSRKHARARPRPLNIGLVWRAGEWRSSRSLPTPLLSPLARLPQLCLYSFQCGAAAGEAPQIPAIDVSSENIARTVANLQKIDLLISVDTFIAHLAAALGVTVWLLLQQDCDWRWMKNRTDCVWYPTMRLFRQRRQGDWRPVIAEVCNHLRCLRDSESPLPDAAT